MYKIGARCDAAGGEKTEPMTEIRNPRSPAVTSPTSSSEAPSSSGPLTIYSNIPDTVLAGQQKLHYKQLPPTEENFKKVFDLLNQIRNCGDPVGREKLWQFGREAGLWDYTI